MNDKNELKYGYTTGSHATSALKVAILSLINKNSNYNNIEITMPEGKCVVLNINNLKLTEHYSRVEVIKSDNDDIDVTKGCKIICWAGNDINIIPAVLNSNEHLPFVIEYNNLIFNIWAGQGVGVATKKGLKVPVGYPAINPVPVQMFENEIKDIIHNYKHVVMPDKPINIIFEVENGIEIAKNTANAKLGIMGGISILGTKGIVKPISNLEYLCSIETEINVAQENARSMLVLTLGNSSLKVSKEYYQLEEDCFIEIGSFVYDTLLFISKYKFNKIVLVSNIGKLTKIAQGLKNTDMRSGLIDFTHISKWLTELSLPTPIILVAKNSNTVYELITYIKREYPECLDQFYKIILEKASGVFKNWLNELGMNSLSFDIMLTDNNNIIAIFEG